MKRVLLALLVVIPLSVGGYLLYVQQQAIDRIERRLDTLPAPVPASEVESLAMRLGSLLADVRALEDQVEQDQAGSPRFGAKPGPTADTDVEQLRERVFRLEQEADVDLAPLEARVAALEKKFRCLEAEPEFKGLYC